MEMTETRVILDCWCKSSYERPRPSNGLAVENRKMLNQSETDIYTIYIYLINKLIINVIIFN